MNYLGEGPCNVKPDISMQEPDHHRRAKESAEHGRHPALHPIH
jgi:hypothetical protein